MRKPRSARGCPRCSLSTQGARLVVFSAGEIFHHRCFVEHGEADEPVHEFLRRHYPSAFCADCLSAALDLTHEQARRLVTETRSARRLAILLGARCTVCRQPRLTVQAERYHDVPDVDTPTLARAVT